MSLRIDLLRHGIAQPTHASGDAARELTPEGAAAVRALGERLGLDAWRPERAFSSPYVRARDTARIVLQAAGVPLVADVMPELEPEFDFMATIKAVVARMDGARHAVLVAHQPLLGRLAHIWTNHSSGLSPGEFIAFEFESYPGVNCGRILGRIPPR